MSDSAKDFETQLAATRGFLSHWLMPELSRPSAQSHEFLELILDVLKVYEIELGRQIEGVLATKDWYTVLTIHSITSLHLRNQLVELKAELAAYDPQLSEPMTIDEMIVRLLSDAHTLFADSINEIGQYLDQQSQFGRLDNLM